MPSVVTMKRAVIVCRCGLTQYDQAQCRRCKKSLHPELAELAARAEATAAAISKMAEKRLRKQKRLYVTDTSRAIGRLIRELRRDQFTQREFAARVGVSVAYICEIERGRRNPSMRMVERFAKAFGWSPSELVHMSDMELKKGDVDTFVRFGPQSVRPAEDFAQEVSA